MSAWLKTRIRAWCGLGARSHPFGIRAVIHAKHIQLDPVVLAQEKQASRTEDELDLNSGHKPVEEIRLENEHFARLARVDLSASRSLG
jgi:hypothetical protein